VWGLVAGGAGSWLLLWAYAQGQLRTSGLARKGSGWAQEWRVLRDFSLPTALAGIAVVPATWLAVSILTGQVNGLHEVATFTAASQWMSALMFLPGVVNQTMLPVLSEASRESAGNAAGASTWMTTKLNLMFTVPIAGLLSIASPFVMGMYGKQYAGSWPVLVVVVWTAMLAAVGGAVSQLLIATGRVWTGFGMNLGWACCFLAGAWLLRCDGAFGVSVARLVAYALHAVWTMAFAVLLVKRLNRQCASDFAESPAGRNGSRGVAPE
jgi:O-antigen/teichoic acid export membrane protein